MASANPFDLLGGDDNDDPSQLLAAEQQKPAPKKTIAPTQVTVQQAALPKMPSKPLPPAQAVRDAKSDDTGRGAGRGGGGRGFGRGGRGGFNKDFKTNDNVFNNGVSGGYAAAEEGDGGKASERGRGSYSRPRAPFRGGRRGGYSNGEADGGERPQRQFERRSGTGRGNEVKREGAGRGNWGTTADEVFVQESEELVNETEKNLSPEKQVGEEDAALVNKENAVNEPEEKEPENKEMTLDEYEKVYEEKRRALQALKAEERKVDLDKEFESMQQLSTKKGSDDIFIKLGSDKDIAKRNAEKEEKAKKSLSITEFLKPAEGERKYGSGGRGRGRGDRGSRGGFAGVNMMMNNVVAPSIEDPGQFPSLGVAK